MRDYDAERPDPDSLLESVQKAALGQLRIFLGAAPGVGKTYAMLQAAHEAQAEGRDVVIGVAESHDRVETLRLCAGLEQLPLKTVHYAENQFQEFDLERALERAPEILLLDEMAHRNCPGSLHQRRYQDIQMLLDQGIEVWTAVNIQHLESLSDVIMTITGIRMKETVPDALFDRANDLVLIDLPPNALIQRLEQGKIYMPEQAQAALEGYFNSANLSALRELAIQQVAERADQDVIHLMREQGQLGPWPVRMRLLALLRGEAQDLALIRAARRMAERRQVPWEVVFVEDLHTSEQQRIEVSQAYRLAEQLGGQVQQLHGQDRVESFLSYARKVNASTLLIGREGSRWFKWRSTAYQLLDQAKGFELIFTADEAEPTEKKITKEVTRWWDYFHAFAAVVLATGLSFGLVGWLPLANMSLVYLSTVLWVGVKTGVKPALFAALVSFAAYNFFFTIPRFTFAMEHPEELLTVVFFFFVALMGGHLAAQLRHQLLALQRINDHARLLLDFNRSLAVSADKEALGEQARQGVMKMIGVRTGWVTRSQDGHLKFVMAADDSFDDDPRLIGALNWAFESCQPCGAGTPTLNALPWRCQPVMIEEKVAGVLLLEWSQKGGEQATESLLETLVHYTSQALERAQLSHSLEASRVAEETERLRSALLSSISHDLRTPLTAMIGSATTLMTMRQDLSEEDQDLLLSAVLSEGQRLNSYIQNLLDMTRLGHGGLKIERDWVAVDELLAAALRRVETSSSHLKLTCRIEPCLPLLHVHPALIEQALVNVLENAAKFSPEQGEVRVEARQEHGMIRIDVTDQGPGIPVEHRERVFDMFFTGEGNDRGPYGSGLGLAICHGMISAHFGKIEATSGPQGRGACIRLWLPVTELEESESADVNT